MDFVRILTLREIAEMWAPDAGTPVSFMLRELRLAAVNIPRRQQGLDSISPRTPDNELPDPDEKVDRDWLVEFCSKQGWEEPTFWFSKPPESERYPGRPTLKRAIAHKLRERAESGELADTLAGEARKLLQWVEDRFPGDSRLPSTIKVVENQIRDQYRQLKNQHH